MTTKNTGGPAFPGNQYSDCLTPSGYSEGLSLRDYFAAKAMQGIFGSGLAQPERQQHFDNIAVDAYLMADAMLKEREI